ncbi:hypothetical protein V6N12_007176 [Hibiscus sabdariffa]|uniref:Uncharacterized protein n=1 Tax=Hibiscus sabdariffa TaxID=183260 RepID=A0ABR2F0Z9_9ROSI
MRIDLAPCKLIAERTSNQSCEFISPGNGIQGTMEEIIHQLFHQRPYGGHGRREFLEATLGTKISMNLIPRKPQVLLLDPFYNLIEKTNKQGSKQQEAME